jgi:flap endonuclease-1
MGIKNLNKFLMGKCSSDSILKKHLGIFGGKTLVIDTSIYLYKFMENSILIENMYLLISILLHYKITPIFVFDGKPPKEKMEILAKRKIEKKEAEIKYNTLKQEMDIASQEEKEEITVEMDKLKKQFVRIKREDIESVKTLMDLYGVTYIEAEGEADQLCAEMVITKKAWACLSDDMDLFVYGCTRVMRHLSLLNHTIVFYNINNILRELQMPMTEFREVMILSGTDYNIHQKITLYKAMKYYDEYNKEAKTQNIQFYDWLASKNIQTEQLREILPMFCVSKQEPNSSQHFTSVTKPKIKLPQLKEWLHNYGFVFL